MGRAPSTLPCPSMLPFVTSTAIFVRLPMIPCQGLALQLKMTYNGATTTRALIHSRLQGGDHLFHYFCFAWCSEQMNLSGHGKSPLRCRVISQLPTKKIGADMFRPNHESIPFANGTPYSRIGCPIHEYEHSPVGCPIREWGDPLCPSREYTNILVLI